MALAKTKPLDTANAHFQKKGLERNTKEALTWYRQYVAKNFSRYNYRNALAAGQYVRIPKPGFLYCYGYDPKTADTLPYYDKFPLILCFKITKTGWYGINLHYVPPRIRQAIFEELLETLNNKNFDETTKFKITWAKLTHFAKHRYIKHACKQYLFSQLMTPLSKVDAQYWEVLTFLPMAQFEKASSRDVWKDA